MRDNDVSLSKLVTIILWVLSAFVFLADWAIWFAGYRDLAIMVGTTAILVVSAAAVSQIRCYSLRICGLLRAIGGLDDARPPVRSIR